MINKVKTIFKVTKELKAQCISMRCKLMLYWGAMLLTAVCLFLFLLSIAGVFSNQQEKLQETLELHIDYTCGEISQHFDHLTAQCIALSEQISDEIE